MVAESSRPLVETHGSGSTDAGSAYPRHLDSVLGTRLRWPHRRVLEPGVPQKGHWSRVLEKVRVNQKNNKKKNIPGRNQEIKQRRRFDK